MIHDVDETLRALLRQDALPGSDVDVVFDAPTKDWSSRRNAPTIDVYLYDIREDMRRREIGRIDTHNPDGRITGRARPPRHYKLSYLVTAWTQRPEDEHRLLSSVLACFNRHDRLPSEFLAGSLAELTLPVPVSIALPPPEDRALSDVWSALGGELKPSLDLVITLPLDTEVFDPAATLVTEQPRITVIGGGAVEHSKAKRMGGAAAAAAAAASASAVEVTEAQGATGGGTKAVGDKRAGKSAGAKGADDITGGTAEKAQATVGGPAEAGKVGDAAARERRRRNRIEETVKAGTDAHPGRVFHLSNRTEPDEESPTGPD